MFAAARLRILKSASGTSGEATRVSIARNAANSAAATASRPSVAADVHPRAFPPTIA